MKGDYLHYKLLTLPAARWLPNPWLGTPGWGGPLAGRGENGGRSVVNDHSFVGAGCTWLLGARQYLARPVFCGLQGSLLLVVLPTRQLGAPWGME